MRPAMPRGAEPVPGVAESIDDAPAEGAAEERREPGGRADRPAPRVGEVERGERGEVAPEARAQRGVVGRRVVAAGVHPVGRVVGGLAGAPEDPVVAGEPVVVEEAAAIGDALACPPPDRLALRRT